jgi:hypothetical protein
MRLLVRPPLDNKSQGLLWIIGMMMLGCRNDVRRMHNWRRCWTGVDSDVFENCLQDEPKRIHSSMLDALNSSVVKGCGSNPQLELLLQTCAALEGMDPFNHPVQGCENSHPQNGPGIFAVVFPSWLRLTTSRVGFAAI